MGASKRVAELVMQAWAQQKPSVISFPIEQRSATAYVFCLLEEEDPQQVDPQDLTQWRFWVVPTRSLQPRAEFTEPPRLAETRMTVTRADARVPVFSRTY